MSPEDPRGPRSVHEERLHQVVRSLAQVQLDLDHERLRRQETAALFDEALDAMSDVVVLVDPRGVVTRANPATAGLLGWDEQDAVGRPVTELLGPAVPSSPWQLLMLHPTGAHAFETDAPHRGGGSMPVSLSGSVVRDAQGRIVGAIYVARDLSETQRLVRLREAAEARWRLLAEVGALLSGAPEPRAALHEVVRRLAATARGRAYAVLVEDAVVREVVASEAGVAGIDPGDRLTADSALGRSVLEQAPQAGAVAAAPLVVQGRSMGALVLESEDPERPADVDLAVQVAARVSLSLQDAALFASEQTARARAERAEQRMSFLAEASATLSASLDPQGTLKEVARLAVPTLGAMAAVGYQNEDGSWAVATVADDPSAAERLEAVIQARLDPSELGAPAVAVPLVIHGGRRGRFVVAREPAYEDEEVAFVEDFARRAAMAVSNASLYDREHQVANVLQASLLPPELPEPAAFAVAACYRPARYGLVGGDFYDVFELGQETWAVLIGDVCGKGVGAAAQTALARYTIRSALLRDPRPSQALALLNTAILNQAAEGRFCTIALGIVRAVADGLEVTLSSGGHPPPILVRPSGEAASVGPSGTLIGVVDAPALSDEVVRLEGGDLLVLYTDGVTEARVGDDLFGEENLLRTLQRLAGRDPYEVVATLEKAAEAVGSIRDDLAVVALRAR